jgi:hypothetical protein
MAPPPSSYRPTSHWSRCRPTRSIPAFARTGLNPVERVWLYRKERLLSQRLLADYDAIVIAAWNAWNRLVAEAGRIKTLCSYPWIPKVNP